MDSLSICWRGMAGTGKRSQLQEALKKVADIRGVPFSIQRKPLPTNGTTGDVTEAGATESGAGPDDLVTGQNMMETSIVHIGLDIARMSMQDKHILRPILLGFGRGSQVMAGTQGRGARILVLYHAHLLSSESVILIQACLEQNEDDVSIWLTSELPVPQRIRDWFIEIGVDSVDKSFQAYAESAGKEVKNWPGIFREIIDKWRGRGPPKLQEVKEIKGIVYGLLMRNLRWVEATHFLLDVILTHPEIDERQRIAAITALSNCEATAGGYTIPSYRIPILWESLFLQLRNIFYKEVSETIVDASTRVGRVSAPRKKRVAAAGTRMEVL
jgi:hypothetical protein